MKHTIVRIVSILIVLVLAAFLPACATSSGQNSDTGDDTGISPETRKMVSRAADELKDYWKNLDREGKEKNGLNPDGHFEIVKTRIIHIRPNEDKDFQDVSHVVEFALYTDYFGLHPYYADIGRYDSVVIYKNGKMEVSDLIDRYQSRYFVSSFDGFPFIESIEDLGDAFNSAPDGESAASAETDAMIAKAREALRNQWKEIYRQSREDRGMSVDGYLEVLRTSVIKVRENDTDRFSDLDYVIEFGLYTDYLGLSPLYENTALYDSVMVYRDGSMEVSTASWMKSVRALCYPKSLSDLEFIESVENLGGRYNFAEKLS